jgi:hypothetical protein
MAWDVCAEKLLLKELEASSVGLGRAAPETMEEIEMSNFYAKAAAVLWASWGGLHVIAGSAMLRALGGGVEGLPDTVVVSLMGSDMPVPLLPTLMEHNLNNAWFGLIVLLGSFFVWRNDRNAMILCGIVGGLAQLGYTIIAVLPGHAPLPGAVMSVVAAVAVLLPVFGASRDKVRQG